MPICSSCVESQWGNPQTVCRPCGRVVSRNERGQIPLGSTVFAQLSSCGCGGYPRNCSRTTCGIPSACGTRRCERTRKKTSTHGMLLGLLRSQGNWVVKSNAETGEGYSDITVQTRTASGIVIELKYAEDGNLGILLQGRSGSNRGPKVRGRPEAAWCEEAPEIRHRLFARRNAWWQWHKKALPASVSSQGYLWKKRWQGGFYDGNLSCRCIGRTRLKLS